MVSKTLASRQADTPNEQAALLNNPKVRRVLLQVALLGFLLFVVYSAIQNAAVNLANQRIASGFDFLNLTAGFSIVQALIPWDESMTYGRAYLVGLLNTLLVAVVAIFFGTILGFLVGIARLVPNWTISRLARWYVEIVRNLPLLFQMLFWYLTMLVAMPAANSALSLGGFIFASRRGITVAQPTVQAGTLPFLALAVVLAIIFIGLMHWSKRTRMATGRGLTRRTWMVAGLCSFAALGVLWVLVGPPIGFDLPQQGRFNLTGGITMIPEFSALVIALAIYNSAFIGEIVRSGIQAVSKGQTEAGRSLGLSNKRVLSRVVIPQAMRVIVPMLTSRYLNITKSSSLGVAVGYPELMAVGGTILNQTGQAIEVVALWIATYVTISLLTSAFMNWYNARIALVER